MASNINDLITTVNNSNFASIKGIISGIFGIINNSKSSVNDLEKVIKLDPPLAAKVLKVANSVFYASKVEFKDLKEAVLWIGFEEVKNIAITGQLLKVFADNSKSEISKLDLWKNSIATAILGQMIYRREYGEKGDNIYTAGLIHNIGIIIMDQFLPDEFHEIIKCIKEEKINHIEVENQFLGYDHTNIAKVLAESWKFPEELTEILRYHHTPKQTPENHQKKTETMYIADYFCGKLKLGYSDIDLDNEQEVFEEYLKKNNIEEESLKLMQQDLYEKIKHLEEIGLLTHEKSK